MSATPLIDALRDRLPRLTLVVLLMAALSLPALAAAEAPAYPAVPDDWVAPAGPPWGTGVSRPEDLHVYLITFSHGDDIASWFGHSALMVEDVRLKVQRVYNYGMFSFGTDMWPKFLMGRLEFWVGEASAPGTMRLYRELNRDIRMQELNLSPKKRLEMARFLAWNVQPENRNYLYHHYDDNCATRPRDVIDRVLDGQLYESADRPGRFTLREHTRRHTQRNPYIDVLLYTWMNEEIDQPIRVWDEMFLPGELEREVQDLTYTDENGQKRPLVARNLTVFDAERAPVPDEPNTFWPYALLFGLLTGGIAVALARWHARSEKSAPRVLLGLYHVFLGLLFGLPGLVLVLFHFTEHTITHFNENNLLLSPLTFMALPFGLAIAAGSARALRWMKWCWYVMAATSLLALAFKALPWFVQDNWITIAMMLPANALFAWALSRFPTHRE